MFSLRFAWVTGTNHIPPPYITGKGSNGGGAFVEKGEKMGMRTPERGKKGNRIFGTFQGGGDCGKEKPEKKKKK